MPDAVLFQTSASSYRNSCVYCSFFTDSPACFLRRLLSLHLDLACQEDVALSVLSSRLRSHPVCAGDTGRSVQPEASWVQRCLLDGDLGQAAS